MYSTIQFGWIIFSKFTYVTFFLLFSNLILPCIFSLCVYYFKNVKKLSKVIEKGAFICNETWSKWLKLIFIFFVHYESENFRKLNENHKIFKFILSDFLTSSKYLNCLYPIACTKMKLEKNVTLEMMVHEKGKKLILEALSFFHTIRLLLKLFIISIFISHSWWPENELTK